MGLKASMLICSLVHMCTEISPDSQILLMILSTVDNETSKDFKVLHCEEHYSEIVAQFIDTLCLNNGEPLTRLINIIVLEKLPVLSLLRLKSLVIISPQRSCSLFPPLPLHKGSLLWLPRHGWTASEAKPTITCHLQGHLRECPQLLCSCFLFPYLWAKENCQIRKERACLARNNSHRRFKGKEK